MSTSNELYWDVLAVDQCLRCLSITKRSVCRLANASNCLSIEFALIPHTNSIRLPFMPNSHVESAHVRQPSNRKKSRTNLNFFRNLRNQKVKVWFVAKNKISPVSCPALWTSKVFRGHRIFGVCHINQAMKSLHCLHSLGSDCLADNCRLPAKEVSDC